MIDGVLQMIRFDFDWSDPVNKGILVVLSVLWLIQGWIFFFRNRQSVNTMQGSVHLILHLALSSTITLMILNPVFMLKTERKSGIVVGAHVPDSVKANIGKMKNADFVALHDLPTAKLDTLFIVGQDFDSSFFSQISTSALQPEVLEWIPYAQTDVITQIEWNAVIRKGELQHIQGKISASKVQSLTLKDGFSTLDSVVLQQGENDFSLQMIANIEGRNEVELWLDHTLLDTLHFYAQPMPKLTFTFLLGHPDFESRTLADWLAKQGNAVLYKTRLTKELVSSTNINQAAVTDFIITDETGLTQPEMKKNLESGKSVLFYNLADPSKSVSEVNRMLGTRFEIAEKPKSLKKASESIVLDADYLFKENAMQISVQHDQVAYETFPGKVGISLTPPTYPLLLSGDSVQYKRFWDSLIAHLRPTLAYNFQIKSPIFTGLNTEVQMDGQAGVIPQIQIHADTLNWEQSPINDHVFRGNYRPVHNGWTSLYIPLLEEEIEMFIEPHESWTAYEKNKRIREYSTHFNNVKHDRSRMSFSQDYTLKPISTWVWFFIITLLLGGIWITDKRGYLFRSGGVY